MIQFYSGTRNWITGIIACVLVAGSTQSHAQHSVARQWSEVLLEAVRNDFARPTVHARNLFHVSMALYDAWAVYDAQATPYFMGNRIGGYLCDWGPVAAVTDTRAAQEEAMSFAAYRLLTHRFRNSPGVEESQQRFDSLMSELGYDINETSVNYTSGPPFAVGNYIGLCLIQFGIQDGSNETNDYLNEHYQPVNPPLVVLEPGNPDILNYNRWQPLTLDVFIDQSGNPIPFNTPEFLSPEWGVVTPFALTASDLTIYDRNGPYWVYYDPGPPPYLNTVDGSGTSDQYKWGFQLVAVWSSHLDPGDGVMWDVSPGSIGNIDQLPLSDRAQQEFYNLLDGGDSGTGHAMNPVTGLPYDPQLVPRGDYTRVLAEFWADGPDSETPPGHWFVILNTVMDHPLFERRYKGEGDPLDTLEWDVKAYFALGGAMHDAAVTAWGIKGWYDYLRPISALRAMADLGQSTDTNLPNYAPGGIELIPGYIEVVEAGDPLAGANDEHVGKIKLYAWRGPEFITDPETDEAGVGWILAENWWPYQRPSFVTPPFAGYISGHSTYSRAAAEVLTLLTGDPFFPGGMSEFEVKRNEFLVFEEGPSVDFTLQWATYRDASDQTSLSRLWGGIHPPADDIPGRLIGEQIGIQAFEKAEKYFQGFVTGLEKFQDPEPAISAYPNPLHPGEVLHISMPSTTGQTEIQMLDIQGRVILEKRIQAPAHEAVDLPVGAISPGIYLVRVINPSFQGIRKIYIRK